MSQLLILRTPGTVLSWLPRLIFSADLGSGAFLIPVSVFFCVLDEV
jgi:hypothetical protein